MEICSRPWVIHAFQVLEGNLEMWKLFYENFERVLEP